MVMKFVAVTPAAPGSHAYVWWAADTLDVGWAERQDIVAWIVDVEETNGHQGIVTTPVFVEHIDDSIAVVGIVQGDGSIIIAEDQRFADLDAFKAAMLRRDEKNKAEGSA